MSLASVEPSYCSYAHPSTGRLALAKTINAVWINSVKCGGLHPEKQRSEIPNIDRKALLDQIYICVLLYIRWEQHCFFGSQRFNLLLMLVKTDFASFYTLLHRLLTDRLVKGHLPPTGRKVPKLPSDIK